MTLETALLSRGYAAGEVTEIVNVFGAEPEKEFCLDLEKISESVLTNSKLTHAPSTQPWLAIGLEIVKNGVPPEKAYEGALQNFAPRTAMAIEALVSMTSKPAPAAASAPAQGRSNMTHPILRDKYLAKYPDTCFGMEEYRRYRNGAWAKFPQKIMRQELQEVIEAEAQAMGLKPTSALLASVEELIKIKVYVADERWDANHDIIVCGNGTLHIPSRTLRNWDKYDYCTIALSYDYDPNATCDTFIWFLENTVPGAQDFLREFAGYCLTTMTRYELALWLFGQPGGGKSTFIAGLVAMLGNLSVTLSLHDIQESSFGLTQLPGKTLAWATEQPSDFIKTAHVLNAIISGEPLQVNVKFKDAFTMTPKAKMVWAMNDFPRVDAGGHGLFRRVKVVEFPPIPELQRDPTVKERIEKEGAGILNWALLGLDRLNARGKFEIPQCVKDATKEFIEGNDVPAIFVEEKMIKDPMREEPSSGLYKAYAEWCLANGHKPLSSTRMAREWKRLGMEKIKRPMGMYFVGYYLKP